MKPREVIDLALVTQQVTASQTYSLCLSALSV